MAPKEEQVELKLKVAEAHQPDVGRGIARLTSENIEALGVSPGEPIELEGARVTGAIAAVAYQADAGLDIVRIDGLIRANAGVGVGETVQVRRAKWKPAAHVTLAPARKGLHLVAPPDSLRAILAGRVVRTGDVVSTAARAEGSPFGDNLLFERIFREFAQMAPGFGLGEIHLKVVSTQPGGLVRITPDTAIELLPEHVEVAERGRDVPEVAYEDIGGLRDVIHKIREMVELPLKKPELFDRLGIEPPRGVLLHGPPGTGKTLLAKAVATETDAHFIALSGPEIMSRFYGESEGRLREIFEQAEKNAPAIIFIDELDSIAPRRAEVTGEVERRVVAQLLTLMDGLKQRRNVIVIAATNRVEAIDPALRRPGRFDREIEVRVPDRDGRKEILMVHTRGMPLASDVDLDKLAGLTHGFVGSDIAALAREAAMNVLRKLLPKINLDEEGIAPEVIEELIVRWEDFDRALKEVRPSAMREVMVEVPTVTWADIGGLQEVQQLLREAVELPLTTPEAFQRLGVTPPKGILLYGPPGTGKTTLAKAVASESQANFITAKGSELLSKWYGESEQRIAEVFRRARQVAPAVVFLDELDALVPRRGSALGEPHVTERIVNQMLAEMDGLEELRRVVVIGATNRPDLVDPALLRPGRFDELIYVPIPDVGARLAIFRVHTRGMALSPDVDLERLAARTAGYTGADIAEVCRKAGRIALRESLTATAVTMPHFEQALEKTPRSVTPELEEQYKRLARNLRGAVRRIGLVPDEDKEPSS
ncbi:MAG: AAA family ATPase Cdc48 [Candidatus Bipolaricaulis sibiricus]|uniref:AAA family ATPase Cdc48 n=1 Tax=Bipolaricaulis sibiricus TaxID=2501609 RepID=A0A410FV44_BIPS1|nr:MAG: AAA family ATPase Cdc48 [Candidatus Bipolaricaulis sibiricus]